jgi:NADH/NAD ratio-sensing transcriptional regulator Rex
MIFLVTDPQILVNFKPNAKFKVSNIFDSVEVEIGANINEFHIHVEDKYIIESMLEHGQYFHVTELE